MASPTPEPDLPQNKKIATTNQGEMDSMENPGELTTTKNCDQDVSNKKPKKSLLKEDSLKNGIFDCSDEVNGDIFPGCSESTVFLKSDDIQLSQESESKSTMSMVGKITLNGPSGDGELCTDRDSEDCATPSHLKEEEEDYCNPMVSDSEEETGEEDIVLRGDRIGNTTYAERHVLKLLMKLVQELPKYTISSDSEKSTDNDNPVQEDIKLEKEFDDEMSLLWDMSAEPDVMSYLVDKDIFTMIRDTLELSKSTRLTEVALGIMANLLSQKTIVEDFHVYDSKLKLVFKVIHLLSKISAVAVLIQIFSVLKRIVWFIKNVKIVDEWIALLLHDDFFEYANFIMASSTNLLLLGDVILTQYTILETLCAENVEQEPKDENPEITAGSSSNANFRSFCDTNFVASICEALTELLKNPKPKVSRHVADFTGGEQNSDFDNEIPLPDDHVQMAILNGLSALTYLKKIPIAQNVLAAHKEEITRFVISLQQKFSLCTENQPNSNKVEYFVLSLTLLEFCHEHTSSILCEEVLTVPISTASELISLEQKNSDEKRILIRMSSGLDFDSVTYIALEMHNYLITISEQFGQHHVTELRKSAKFRKFFSMIDRMVAKVCDATEDDDKSE